MGSESSLHKAVRKRVPSRGHYVRVENSIEEGTPDVWLSYGMLKVWMELKHSHEWPKRKDTIVRLRHFTEKQKEWLIKEGIAGGCAAVLWQVEKEYMVFPWWEVGELGNVKRLTVYSKAIATTRQLSWKWLYDNLNKCRKAI